MVDLPTNWVDNTGMIEDAAFLNLVGGNVNTLSHGRPAAGTFSSRPAAGNAGALYFSQDNDTLYRDNGTTWDKIRIGADSCDAMGDVPTSGWTAVNMLSGASWAADKGDMLLTVSTAQTSIGFQYRAYPTPPFTLTAYLDPVYLNYGNIPLGANQLFLSGLAISDGTKYETFGPASMQDSSSPWSVGQGVIAVYWSTSSGFVSAYNSGASNESVLGRIPKWFRYNDDGTNKTYSASFNGTDWIPIATAGHTSNLTPTHIGIFGLQSGSQTALLRVRSWNGVS